MKKRILAFLLVVCMVASMLPIISSAEGLTLNTPVTELEWEYDENLTWTFKPEKSGNYYFYVNMFLEEPIFSVQLGGNDVPGTQAQYLGTGYVYNLTAGETYTLNASHQDGLSSGEQRVHSGVEFAIREVTDPTQISLPDEMRSVYTIERIQGFLIPDVGVDTITSLALVKDNVNYAGNITSFAQDTLFFDLNLSELQLSGGEYALEIETASGLTVNEIITISEPVDISTLDTEKEISIPAGEPLICKFTAPAGNSAADYIFYLPHPTSDTLLLDCEILDSNLDCLDWARNYQSENYRGFTYTFDPGETYYLRFHNNDHDPFEANLTTTAPTNPAGMVFPSNLGDPTVGALVSFSLLTTNPGGVIDTPITWTYNMDEVDIATNVTDPSCVSMTFKKEGQVTVSAKTTTANGAELECTRVFNVQPAPPSVSNTDSVAEGSKNITVPAGESVYYQFNFDKNQPYVFYFDKTEETDELNLSFYNLDMNYMSYSYNDSLDTRGWAFTPNANQTYFVECHNSSNKAISFTLNIALGETPTEIVFDHIQSTLRLGDEPRLYVRAVTPTDLLGTFQWTSSDPTIAELHPDSNDTFGGRVELKKPGFVTFTAEDTTNNLTISKTFLVASENDPTEYAAIYGNDGTYDVYFNSVLLEKNADSFTYPEIGNNSLASMGISVTNPVYWTQRDFVGWDIYTLERIYDSDGNLIDEGNVLLPGAEHLTTAQMLAYVLPAGKEVNIYAQWEGDNLDYYSGVGFHAYDGQITIQQDDLQEQTDSRGDNFRQNDTTIGSQMNWTIQSVTRENYTFEGWLQYRDYSQDIEGKMDLVDDTVYSFQQILAMTVPEDETVFVAKYQEIDIEEYRNAFPGFPGEGEDGQESFIPEDATVTDLTKGTAVKLPFNDGEPRYFRFTAPADGYYAIRTSGEGHFEVPGFAMAFSAGHDYKLSFYMGKDDSLEFVFIPFDDTSLVIEDTPYITKLELASQDTSKTFVKGNDLYSLALLDGIRVKATLSDGKIIEKDLSSNFDSNFIGGFMFNAIDFDIENAIGNTAPVTVHYDGASFTYNVKLDSRKPTKLEVIFSNPVTDIYENSLGDYADGPNGPFYQYHIVDAIMGTATYRVTWNDDSTEDFKINEGGYYFHGLSLKVDEPMWIQEQSPWGVGKHTANVYLGDNISTTVTFEIKPNPIDHIEFLSIDSTLLLGDPDFFADNGDGTWTLEGIRMNGLRFKAYFKDGTSKVYTIDDSTDWETVGELIDNHLALIYYDGYQAASVSKPGKITTYLSWMGATDTFETTIVDQIVTDNEVSLAPSVVDTAIQNATQNTVTLDATQSTSATDTITSVVLPLTSMETMADNTMDLEVKLSDDAVVKLDNKALQSLLDQAEGTDITLVVEQVKAENLTEKQQKQLKDKKVGLIISAQLLSDGQPIWTKDDNQNANKDGSITISVPFTPPAGTKGERFSIWFVDDDGNMTKMPTKYVDGTLQFNTWHFSDYVALEDDEPEATTPETEATTPETEATTPETEATQPKDDIVPNNPQTGDTRTPVLFVGLMLACALAVVMLTVLRKNSYT